MPETAIPEMTMGEWDAKPQFHMSWCATVEEDDAAAERVYDEIVKSMKADGRERLNEDENKRWQEAYDNRRLDLTARGIPDGMHTVYHVAYRDHVGRSAGLIVRDGKFEPYSTQATVFEAVCKSYGTTADEVRSRKSGIDHVFIEAMVWDAEQNAIRVCTGS